MATRILDDPHAARLRLAALRQNARDFDDASRAIEAIRFRWQTYSGQMALLDQIVALIDRAAAENK